MSDYIAMARDGRFLAQLERDAQEHRTRELQVRDYVVSQMKHGEPVWGKDILSILGEDA